MPSSCCVPLCPSKSNSTKTNLFKVPANEVLRLQWANVLGVTFKSSSKVCLKHFNKEDVISTWESGKGFNKYTVSIKL